MRRDTTFPLCIHCASGLPVSPRTTAPLAWGGKEDQFCQRASAPCSCSFCFFFSSFLSLTLRRLAFPMPPAWRMDSRRLARPVEGFTTSFGAPWTKAAGTGRTGSSHWSVQIPMERAALISLQLLLRAVSQAQPPLSDRLTLKPSQQKPCQRGTEGLQLPGRQKQLPLPLQLPSSAGRLGSHTEPSKDMG